MIETPFTKLVGASAPIQAAPLPAISTVELVAAVADAGGVGMLAAPMLSPEFLEEELARVAKATSGIFGVNFLVPFLDPACIPVAARHARVVDFFFGDPQRTLVDEARAFGAVVGWQVGSLEEAIAAERAGCDYVVAQGTEAGGHVRGQTSLLPLLSQVLDALRIPVLAAGGIATARDLAAVLAAGASGARIGTRFVAAVESAAHPAYVNSLLAATATDTCLTDTFAEWPVPHRVLRSAIAAVNAAPEGVIGEIEHGGRRIPIHKLSPFAPNIATTGHVEAMALYAGESVTHVTSVRPAAEIVAELVAGAEQRLRATR